MSGRVSPEALADLAVAPVVHTRAEPPEVLSAAEADVWRAILAARPAGWFTGEMEPMMRNLCAHVVNSRVVEQELRDFKPKTLKDPKGLQRFNTLTKLHIAQTNMIALISARLRLTPQARYDRFTTSTAAKRAAQEAKSQAWDRAA